eukprot:GHVO01024344.1.p1 GENE.GHVO01024344.1~~GHVO01024344.1.p1  ORF type:complete len:204 (+),score=13.48 GHVO01024344.1:188-799(+)
MPNIYDSCAKIPKTGFFIGISLAFHGASAGKLMKKLVGKLIGKSRNSGFRTQDADESKQGAYYPTQQGAYDTYGYRAAPQREEDCEVFWCEDCGGKDVYVCPQTLEEFWQGEVLECFAVEDDTSPAKRVREAPVKAEVTDASRNFLTPEEKQMTLTELDQLQAAKRQDLGELSTEQKELSKREIRKLMSERKCRVVCRKWLGW